MDFKNEDNTSSTSTIGTTTSTTGSSSPDIELGTIKNDEVQYIRSGQIHGGSDLSLLDRKHFQARLVYWKKQRNDILMNICSHDDSNFGMNIRILDDDVKVDVLQSFVAVLADTSGSMSKPFTVINTALNQREQFPVDYDVYKKQCAKQGMTLEEAGIIPRLATQFEICRNLEFLLHPVLRYHFKDDAIHRPADSFFEELSGEGATNLKSSIQTVYNDMMHVEEGKIVPLLILTDEKMTGVPMEQHFSPSFIQHIFITLSLTSYDPVLDITKARVPSGESTFKQVNNRRYSRPNRRNNSVRATDSRAVPNFSTMLMSQGSEFFKVDSPAVNIDGIIGRLQHDLDCMHKLRWMRVRNDSATGLVIRGGGVTALIPPQSCVTVPRVPEGCVELFVELPARGGAIYTQMNQTSTQAQVPVYIA